MDFEHLDDNVDALVKTWMPERAQRMARKALDQADFEALTGAGLTLTGVPKDLGGLWEGAAQSARPVAMLLRKLAGVDPSLALMASMHSTVLLMWTTEPADGGPVGWKKHQEDVLGMAKAGHWFGTIASEPGIGADLFATKATASLVEGGMWCMGGHKFMRSRSHTTAG